MEPAMPMKETVDLRSVFVTLWRRRWVVVVPAVLAAATAWVVTLPRLMKPVFQSQCTLKVEFPQRLAPGLQQLVQNPEMGEMIARLNSQIQDNAFLLSLARITGLRDDPGFGEWATRSASRYPDLDRESLIDLKVSDWLRDRIRLGSASRRGVAENLFTIAVLDYDPGRARTLVQNIASGIIEANKSEQTRQAQSTGDFSATQLEEYQRRLRAAEVALAEYQQRAAARSASPTLVTAASVAQADALRERAALELEELERAVARQASALRQAGGDPGAVERTLDERNVGALLSEARGLEDSYVRQTLLDAATGRGGSQGAAINLSRKLEAVQQAARQALAGAGLPSTAAEAAGSYLDFVLGRQLARHRLSLYDRHLGDYRQRIGSSPGIDLEAQRLQSEVEQYRQLQNAFVMQMASSQISEAFGASVIGNKISVLEPAQYPLRPIRPKRTQILLLSVLAGFALGIGGVFLLEHHDPSFKDVRDIERGLRHRVLGAVPNMPAFARSSRGSRRRGDAPGEGSLPAVQSFLDASPGLQEFRKVVLALLHAEGPNPRSIMITSSRRGEGKSTTSICLAHALARELTGERIILVDLDTRRPSLGAYAGATGQGKVILSRQEWQGDPLRPLALPNLRLLVPESEPKGVDLVTLPSVRWLLERLRGEADRIVIDSPPNLPVPDALIIGPEVDSVLLVIKAGETPRETARRGLELQRQFRDNIAGILLNNSAEVLPYYYTYSHYGYGNARRG